jgi:hypothetical protein
MKANNNQTGEKTMTTKQIDDIKRLLAKFEQEYGMPLSMPSPSVYETAIVRLNDEILAQAQRDGVVSRELQCERDQTEARWQMAMTFAPFVNAIPSLLADLDEVIRDRNEWADSTRGANQRMREAEDRVKLLLCDLEAAQKREQVLREAMTGLLEYVPSDAQLVDGGVAATDTPRNRALLKAHTALEAR